VGYNAIRGRRPMERASKASHSEIINNQAVQEFLGNCAPLEPPRVESLRNYIVALPESRGSIKAVVAVDGGMTETFVREDFPSASIVFMTFGPLLMNLDELNEVDSLRFIGPDDMVNLKRHATRYVAVVPAKLVSVRDTKTFSEGVRQSIKRALEQHDGELQKALAWLLFREWRPTQERVPWTVPQCPAGCGMTEIGFESGGPVVRACPGCGLDVYLSDTLRLYERIDDDLGAGGIMSYLLTTLEHLSLVHLIRSIWEMKPAFLRDVLFIKDGPLAFFGTTAPLRKPMFELMRYLGSDPDGPCINLVGVEKSGAFVEHAAHIEDALGSFEVLVLNNEYIRRYIVPGDANTQPYGENMYFGGKIIFKGKESDMYVATVPMKAFSTTPKLDDFFNVADVLHTIARLRCSMYDNALVPVALVNRLVSLADVPTSDILAKFARDRMGAGT
jgi:hypothetical protein